MKQINRINKSNNCDYKHNNKDKDISDYQIKDNKQQGNTNFIMEVVSTIK